jgi:hypothetical protein
MGTSKKGKKWEEQGKIGCRHSSAAHEILAVVLDATHFVVQWISFKSIAKCSIVNEIEVVIYPRYHRPSVTFQKFWIRSVPSSGKHRILGNDPTSQGWRDSATKPKKTNLGNYPCHHFSILRLAHADRISPPISPSRVSQWPGVGTQAFGQTCPVASHCG